MRSSRGSWSLWLCLHSYPFLILFQQIVATNVPPEDQDGSGDDSDNFSGSGAGALQDLTLSQQPSSTWKGTELLTAVPTAPEPSGTDNTATSTSILPAGERPEDREAVLPAEVEPGFTAREKETTHPPGETTPPPTTHQASTARATTAQGPVTSHPHRDMQPDHHETSASWGSSSPCAWWVSCCTG
uniref:Syndecan 1 n=1 Tax=Panthera tigris altaica TaxID=74533 RepID=A0A8C9KJB0_PANTA